jgi:hypothetical protein
MATTVRALILGAMAWTRRAIASLWRLVASSPFESAVVLLALAYVSFRFSGSSYALALRLLGEDASPAFGTPRPIRTDEWSVMTPLFQAAVNNDFHETNSTSFYGETFRSFIGLPLLNWGLVFKPLVWPFFLVSPALAYSFYWAANAALMLVGWSVLLRTLGFSRTVAGFTSVFLYLSPFVQVWSGPGPQLSLFPWVVLAVVRTRSPGLLAAELAVLVPVWCISLFYLPGLPPLAFLAVALCLAFRSEVFRVRRLAPALGGIGVGLAITFVYLSPVFRAFADSIYPGSRWVNGGDLSVWRIASQVLPGTTTEGFTNLVAPNICEAATVATWIPLLAVFALDWRQLRARYAEDEHLRVDVRRIGILLSAWGVLTLWQVLPLLPLSYLLGWGFSPEERTVFASGALVLLAAAYAIDRLPLRLTALRLTGFIVVVVVAWAVASFDLQPTDALKVRDELLVLPLVVGAIGVMLAFGPTSGHKARSIVLLTALLPAISWGAFNPLQDTRVIFRKPDTRVTRELDRLAATREDGAIAVEIPDAILNGAGYRSVTHVIVTPSPDLFRPYFTGMNEERFNRIFNRYAHVLLTTRPRPFVVQNDVIGLPIRTMARYAATKRPAR